MPIGTSGSYSTSGNCLAIQGRRGRQGNDVLAAIEHAEQLGIQAAWMPTGGVRLDSLTTLAAAALRTHHIFLGTSIVPTFPRYPQVVALQTLVMAQLATLHAADLGPAQRPAPPPRP